MLVLAIDTTSEHGGVALFRDGECLASAPNTGSSGYSVTLFQAVDHTLAEAGAKLSKPVLNLQDVELFAAANGPGSFTGIRTGLAATQGWATALNRPAVGVSILRAMAIEAQFSSEWAASIMDARRGEFYLGLFRRLENSSANAYKTDGEGLVLKPNELHALLEERLNSPASVTAIIRDHDEAAQTLRRELSNAIEWRTVSGNLLQSISRWALETHRRGTVRSPAELDACYIRRSDAELNWRA